MPHTILAVDDSATMRKVLEITFEGAEFKLVTADTPSAALEKLKTERPSLVIADVSLPPSDGYELCSTIKLAQPQLPVLMLSSKHHPFDATKGAKADDHIDKPFDTQQLTDKVRKMLDGAPAGVAAAAPALGAAKADRPTTESPPAFNKVASAPPAAAHTPPPAAAAAAGPLGAIRKIGPTGDTQRPIGPATPRQATPAPPGTAARQPPPVITPARRTMAFGPPPVPSDLATTRPGTGPIIRSAPPQKVDPAAAMDQPPLTSPLGTPTVAKRRVGADTLPGVKVAEEQKAGAAEPAPRRAPETPAPPPAVETAPLAGAPAGAAAALGPALDADLTAKVRALGLTAEQVQAVAALSRELIERVVWEVVPPLAELLIKEEIARLTRE